MENDWKRRGKDEDEDEDEDENEDGCEIKGKPGWKSRGLTKKKSRSHTFTHT